MEGNACYKLSTIKNFITMTHADEVKIIVDIGVNVGDVSLLMYHYFPAARIFGFEAVKEYFDLAMERTKDITNITLYNEAVTAQHRFFDDFGEKPRHTNRKSHDHERDAGGGTRVAGRLAGGARRSRHDRER